MDALSGLPFVPGLNLGPKKKAIHGLFIPEVPVDIDAEAAREALRALGVASDTGEATRVLQQYDANGNGLMDLAEFSRLVKKMQRGTGVAAQVMDAVQGVMGWATGSGTSSATSAGRRGSGAGGSWSDSEIRAAFRHFDTNDSGKLDYKELKNALRATGLDVRDDDEPLFLPVSEFGNFSDAAAAERQARIAGLAGMSPEAYAARRSADGDCSRTCRRCRRRHQCHCPPAVACAAAESSPARQPAPAPAASTAGTGGSTWTW